ncbi:MAG: phosphoserine transaminase [Lentisphaerae bacterium GWF2_38_69]|nr:MAG: phosphoserine transaminase [Lentisphaerae bacterium GWF2_38_69]
MKIFNFSAGPSMIPHKVMDKAQKEFLNYNGMGIGVSELSHRTIEFSDIIDKTENNIRKLMNIPTEYSISYIPGGASLQFYMIPANFLINWWGCEYIHTGYWSEKAIVEAQKCCYVRVSSSSRDANFRRIPNLRKWKNNPDSSYVHITTNNTIEGTQYHSYPEMEYGVPLVADMSSDIMTKVTDIKQFDMVYASTQKVLGPTGLALVIMKKKLTERSYNKNLPTMLDYNTYIHEKSMHNTPPTFSVYMLMLVTDWLLEQGGIETMDKINMLKSEVIYEKIDASGGYYKNLVEAPHRSRVNIVFRLPTKDLSELFIHQAEEEGLLGLRGHRSVEGIRASMYNAMPLEGVERLVDFMDKFERTHG